MGEGQIRGSAWCSGCCRKPSTSKTNTSWGQCRREEVLSPVRHDQVYTQDTTGPSYSVRTQFSSSISYLISSINQDGIKELNHSPPSIVHSISLGTGKGSEMGGGSSLVTSSFSTLKERPDGCSSPCQIFRPPLKTSSCGGHKNCSS